MISFTCPHCLAGIRAPDGSAGHNSRCPKCNSRVVVPGRPVPTELAAQPQPPAGPTTLHDPPEAKIQPGVCCPRCGRSASKDGKCPHCDRPACAAAELVEDVEEVEEVPRKQYRERDRAHRKMAPGRVAAAWSLVFGIVACLCCFVPPVWVAVAPLGTVGLILALISGRKAAPAKPSGTATAGVILSLVAVALALALIWDHVASR